MDDVAGGDGTGGVDFLNFKKSGTWVELSNAEVRCAVASRAALRVSANICVVKDENFPVVALSVFRATLTAAVRSTEQAKNMSCLETSSSTAFGFLEPVANLIYSNQARYAARSAANAAASAALPNNPAGNTSAISAAEFAVKYSVTSAGVSSGIQSADTAARIAAHSAASKDSVRTGISKYLIQLWHDIEVPAAIAKNHEILLSKLAMNRETWGFWHDWYHAMWEGRVTDWDWAIEVAQIADDIWEKGAEEVAAEIAKIKVRRTLEAEIAALKEQLRQTQTTEPPHHRLHNNPPEAIESHQRLKNEITLIWELLEETETEIAKPAPSPSILRAIADALWEISLRIGKYCASLADVALKKSTEVIFETGTKAGIAVFVTTTAAQNEGVKAVAHAIWEFVKTLPAG